MSTVIEGFYAGDDLNLGGAPTPPGFIFARPNPPARSARSGPVPTPFGVIDGELMPVAAMSLAGVLRREPVTTKNVDSLWDQFQVRGIDAQAHTAQVVQPPLPALRQGSTVKLVDGPVRQATIGTIACLGLACPRPQPATVGPLSLLIRKPLWQRLKNWRTDDRVSSTVAPKSRVVHSAQPPRFFGAIAASNRTHSHMGNIP